jgi:hypothetical protein
MGGRFWRVSPDEPIAGRSHRASGLFLLHGGSLGEWAVAMVNEIFALVAPVYRS